MKKSFINERAEAIASGKFVRVAALGHDAMGLYRVKVIFRGPGGAETAYWMDLMGDDIYELFCRADKNWQKIKAELFGKI